MASSSTDFLNRDAAATRQKRKVPYKFLVPLIYAPILPLVRIAFRRNPVVRDRLFYGVLAAAFAHGTYIVYPLFSSSSSSSISFVLPVGIFMPNVICLISPIFSLFDVLFQRSILYFYHIHVSSNNTASVD